MLYKEERMDLFSVSSDYALVHCISSDFKMGAGIAKRFTELGVRDELIKNYDSLWDGHGYCCKTTGGKSGYSMVFNLVTKGKYYEKPTYVTLRESLIELYNQVNELKVYKIAMPLIGCGLDRLNWQMVSVIIQDIFKDLDIEILVCYI